MGVFGSIAGAVGSAAWSVAKGVGNVGWAGAKMAGKATLAGADHAVIGAYKTGKSMAKGAAHVAGDIYKARNERGMKNIIGKEIHTAGAMAKGFGDWQRARDIYNPATGELTHHDGKFKLGNFGRAAFFGPAAVAGAVGASQAYMDGNVGASDGQVVTATPTVAARQYSIDNAGATGDLVFALHNNRHG